MGVGSGIGGQFGFASEASYGAGGTPNRFMPVNKVDIKKGKTVAQGSGLMAGQLVELASQRVPTTRDAKGTFDMDLQSNGMGLLLQALMGTTVTPVQQGSTAAYLQTHTLGLPLGKSLVIQTGIPDTTGTVRPYTYQGCKVVEADFSFDITATVPCVSTWTIDAQDVLEVPTLAAASYPTTLRPFVGTDVTIKVGSVGSEASVDGVTKVDVKIPRPMKTSRFYFGNGGTKKEPLTNAYAQITGTITADFVDKTLWADRFAADTSFSLVVEAKGALIAGTNYQTFRVTLPGCFLDGDTPVLDGPDVVTGAFPFTYRFDGTNLPKIEYVSTDITL